MNADCNDKTLTDLEYEVLLKFCKSENITCPKKDCFEVIDRNRSPVGFMTDLKNNQAAQELKNERKIYESIPNAETVVSKQCLGFLLFFGDNSIEAIEGYVFGEEWPNIEWPIVFGEKLSRKH